MPLDDVSYPLPVLCQHNETLFFIPTDSRPGVRIQRRIARRTAGENRSPLIHRFREHNKIFAKEDYRCVGVADPIYQVRLGLFWKVRLG